MDSCAAVHQPETQGPEAAQARSRPAVAVGRSMLEARTTEMSQPLHQPSVRAANLEPIALGDRVRRARASPVIAPEGGLLLVDDPTELRARRLSCVTSKAFGISDHGSPGDR